MNIPFVDLKAQYLSIKVEIDAAIADVIENTAFIGGQVVQDFAEKFEAKYGVEYCVPCANGTDALYIAMKVLGIGPGDEVITTASSWISTSETITQTGAQVVFVDIDQYNTIDVNKIQAAISPRTKAIIPVHLYGQMCDMEAITRLAKAYNLRIIEDCAQSHFSSLNGVLAGVFGDFGTFSFYPGKNLGAYGDAGCLITRNTELAMKAKRYANHGALIKHNHEVEGINSRLDGIQAAVLNVKLDFIEEWTKGRERVALAYDRVLSVIPGIEPPKKRDNVRHTYHVYGIKCNKREELRAYLTEFNIPVQIHYPVSLPLMPAYSYLGHTPDEFPEAFRLQNEELSLPIFPEMTDDQINYVCSAIRRFFNA